MIKTVEWTDEGVRMIDQRLLPTEEKYLMLRSCEELAEAIKAQLIEEAQAIFREDIESNRALGRFGGELIPDGATVLTHCNAGALATAGDYGTALGVVRGARDAGKRVAVIADETRPFLQGARLTAWELQKDEIPVTILTDNMEIGR